MNRKQLRVTTGLSLLVATEAAFLLLVQAPTAQARNQNALVCSNSVCNLDNRSCTFHNNTSCLIAGGACVQQDCDPMGPIPEVF